MSFDARKSRQRDAPGGEACIAASSSRRQFAICDLSWLGIVVAKELSDRVRRTSPTVSNLNVVSYAIQFTFEDRSFARRDYRPLAHSSVPMTAMLQPVATKREQSKVTAAPISAAAHNDPCAACLQVFVMTR